MKALGLIEVYGYLPAVEALDSAVKAANVSLVEVTLVEGGLVAVMITGDVGAVKAAVEAAKVSAARVGKLISVHVIARPSKELDKILTHKNKKEIIQSKVEPVQQETFSEGTVSQVEIEDAVVTSAPEEIKFRESETLVHSKVNLDEIQGMTVDQLRKLARELEVNNMTRKEIRFATKHELIDKISKFIEEERD